ncbi:MAG: hypothetical protein ACREJ3_12220 [Polyangiaceae bacterium]
MSTSDLTPKEQTNVRTALKFLRSRTGTWATLARALRVGESTASNTAGGYKMVSASMTFRVARFAQVSVDDVLSGKFPAPGTCPHCGHHAKDDERNGASRRVDAGDLRG